MVQSSGTLGVNGRVRVLSAMPVAGLRRSDRAAAVGSVWLGVWSVRACDEPTDGAAGLLLRLADRRFFGAW
ncbi:hypothetical protein [Embleya hyalina]|uniref:Uncharacterized protein n=1 Tax=Embleya hyalina TaxID=516124 RepID=A0A401Z2G8_9ACTN|nr:hypothetical protein [Embleya hyalina]GCE01050.1 hypothetical protein EHYA_08789 [Embleya hyalina]